MDKEFLMGCLTAMVIVLGITYAITLGYWINMSDELNFAQICVSHNRQVVYENVNDNLVSECK